MAKKKEKKSGLISTNQTVADNRRARFDYILEDTFEAGLMLTGSEVKVLRHGQCSINEAYVGPKAGSKRNAIKAVVQEFGSVKQAAQPYMRPAWEATKGAVLDGIKGSLRTEIDKAAKRAAARALRLAAKG